jgi:hypothetical protein
MQEAEYLPLIPALELLRLRRLQAAIYARRGFGPARLAVAGAWEDVLLSCDAPFGPGPSDSSPLGATAVLAPADKDTGWLSTHQPAALEGAAEATGVQGARNQSFSCDAGSAIAEAWTPSLCPQFSAADLTTERVTRLAALINDRLFGGVLRIQQPGSAGCLQTGRVPTQAVASAPPHIQESWQTGGVVDGGAVSPVAGDLAGEPLQPMASLNVSCPSPPAGESHFTETAQPQPRPRPTGPRTLSSPRPTVPETLSSPALAAAPGPEETALATMPPLRFAVLGWTAGPADWLANFFANDNTIALLRPSWEEARAPPASPHRPLDYEGALCTSRLQVRKCGWQD